MKTRPIRKISTFFIGCCLLLGISGCTEKDLITVPQNVEASLTFSNTDAQILTEDIEGQVALQVSWTKPDFGVNVVPTYNLVFQVNGSTLEPRIVKIGTALNKDLLVEELNLFVNEAGGVVGIQNEVSINLQVLLGTSIQAESAVETIPITTYSTVLDLSSPWGVVGSATPNGWDGPDLPFYKDPTNGDRFIAYVDLIAGEIKIRKDNDWAVNYGGAGLSGTLVEGGDNMIIAEAGRYKVVFDIASLEYSIEPFTWGIVGSATLNAWDGPDLPLVYDATSDQWRAVVTLTDGEIKFRQNNDWALNYGDTGADGTLEEGGDNIAVSAGNYLVTVNLNELEYTIEVIDIWGLVGSATPNGWDGPDVRFTPDYTNADNEIWVLDGVTLIDGEIKFRLNDDWGLNYGDTGADGTLDQDGDNIPVSAGTYKITLDFSVPGNLTYTIE